MPTPNRFKSTVCADEIVAAGSTIELEFGAAVDPQSVQAAISLRQACKVLEPRAEVAKRGRVVRLSLDDRITGAVELVISELVSTSGERLVDEQRVPFSVIRLAGQVPADLRIEHAVRIVIGDTGVTRLAPGEKAKSGFVDAVKAVSRKTGAPVELAFDEHGKKVSLDKQLAQLGARIDARYGRIHQALFEHIEAAKADKVFPVAVWPRFELPAAPFDKPSDRRLAEPPEGERKVAARLREARDALAAAVERSGLKISRKASADLALPCLFADATVAQIRKLARAEAVGAIHFDDQTAITDLGTSISIARSDLVHLAGFDGTGIRVAVWEDGPSNTTNLAFAGRFKSSPPASDHARLTSAIVKNTESGLPHGHAPDCDLYSANTASTDALRWAVTDQHCTVVSQSFHRSSEPGGSGLQSDDLLKDWLALRWPYPTIVQAAGNFWLGDADGISPPEDEYVNHKGYNSLAIGNHNDAASAMSGDSVFRNPATTHGDRELPELAANGTGVSANGQNKSGTSFAAPATAGVVALLQDADGVLCSWPEGCRAILLASAGRNIRGDTWWRDVVNRVDRGDGAGAVDARAALSITQQRRWRDAPATRHGWDVGTFSSSAVDANRLAKFRYKVKVPNLLFSPVVKVALAWDSAVTSSGNSATASTLTVDLDLLVRDSAGNQVASSASWDNSYEVVEFAARRGETYDIIIRRWSGTDSVWFGAAWTVTGFSLLATTELATIATSLSP